MTDIERFIRLIDCRHPCVSIVTFEEDYALSTVRHAAMEKSMDLWLWSVSTGLRDGMLEASPALADTEHPAAALYRISRGDLKGVIILLDVAGHLKDERTRRMLREASAAAARTGAMLVLIDSAEDLPSVISATFTRFELSLPESKELEDLIRSTLRQINEERRISVNVSRGDLSTIIRNLRGLTRRQARQVIIETVAEDRRFDGDDINSVLVAKRRALGGGSLLECIEAPTSLDEIGGLNRLKHWLRHRENALSDEASDYGLCAPRGVMMLGVQGAGKSLAAKAIATAWKRPLLRMDVGALYDRYIGESERRLRDALAQAEAMAPIVLWIDEIEKGFASAASQSSDGGLSKRMFGKLLTWMQEHQSPVFLVATANDIEALPPELLRKGRFDEIFFVDLPTPEARKAIFQIHLKKRKRDPKTVDLDALVNASEGYSGAEIEAAILSAMHEAYAGKTELATQHVLKSIKDSPPLSITMREKVAALRTWAVGRCVPAD